MSLEPSIFSCFLLHISISFRGPVFSPLVNTRPYKPQRWSDLSAHKPKTALSLQVPTDRIASAKPQTGSLGSDVPLVQSVLPTREEVESYCSDMAASLTPVGEEGISQKRTGQNSKRFLLQKSNNRKLNLGFSFSLCQNNLCQRHKFAPFVTNGI